VGEKGGEGEECEGVLRRSSGWPLRLGIEWEAWISCGVCTGSSGQRLEKELTGRVHLSARKEQEKKEREKVRGATGLV
jgi:hypothetical protein